jgi:molybdopterin molybdotransferase
MLSVTEARRRVLARFQPVSTESLPLSECGQRVLAHDIAASEDLPLFDNSSMDGFALRAVDTLDADSSRITLRVIADIPAGLDPHISLEMGETARIMTGSPILLGADAVIPVEDTDFHHREAGSPAPKTITINRSVKPGEFVRPRGMDVRKGEPILNKGRRLKPQDVGLLAMLGVPNVQVYRKPRVALLSSGDELLEVDAPLESGKIRDSNSYTLAALIEDAGAEVIRLGVARDNLKAVERIFDKATRYHANLILSSAGMSVGAFDFVKEFIEAHGKLDFWRVNMRPGKPLAFGEYRGIQFIGLPGNPVSAFVGFEVFVREAIGRLAGLEMTVRPRVRVRLAEQIESDGRESYLRAVVLEDKDGLVAHLTGHQGSGNLLSLVRANALLIIPAGVKCVPAMQGIDAWLL